MFLAMVGVRYQLPLDGAPVAEGEAIRAAEEDRRPHAGDAHRLLLLLAAVAVGVAVGGEDRRVRQRRPGGEEAAGQRALPLRVQPLDGVPALPNRHLRTRILSSYS